MTEVTSTHLYAHETGAATTAAFAGYEFNKETAGELTDFVVQALLSEEAKGAN